jgi:2-aminoadipate transaminase
MVIGKQATDVHTNTLSQAIIDRFLRKGLLPAQLEKSNRIHGARKDKMINCIQRYFPQGVHFTKPTGGLFIWAQLPEGVNTLDVLNVSIKRNVAFIPGTHFFAEGGGLNTMRLNFSNSSDERIERGIQILAESIKEFI